MADGARIYTFAETLSNSTSLMLLPIYDYFLTTEDSGAVELLSVIIDVAIFVFGALVVYGFSGCLTIGRYNSL